MWFKYIAKNIERFFSYLVCSQIWLKIPMDHHHFGYKTKLPKNIESNKHVTTTLFQLVANIDCTRLSSLHTKQHYFGGVPNLIRIEPIDLSFQNGCVKGF